MDYYEEYQKLLKSGMFWVIFPQLSGNWKDDMVDFIEFKVTGHAHLNGL